MKPIPLRQVEAGPLAFALQRDGITNPATGKPWTEAMLFGLGGGIGVGYYTFEYPGMTTLYLNTRHMTRESKAPGFHENMGARAGLKPVYINTPKPEVARRKLAKAINDGHTPVVWVSLAALPWYGESDIDMTYHTIAVTERADVGTYTVKDRPADLLTISEDDLIAAAMHPFSPKFRALWVEPLDTPVDLKSTCNEAIRACADQMLNGWPIGRSQANTGVHGLRKWANMMTNEKDKKGWPKLFSTPKETVERLISIFQQIETRGEPGALRTLYADFLKEAAAHTEIEAHTESAAHARKLAKQWTALAGTLLPQSINELGKIGGLIKQKDDLILKSAAATSEDLTPILKQLTAAIRNAGNLTAPVLKDLRHQIADTIEKLATAEETLFQNLT